METLCEGIAEDGYIQVKENNYDRFEHIFEGKTSKNKKRRAKRNKHFDDYYEFKSNSQKLDTNIEISEDEEELDEDRLADQDYLNKRKQILKKKFQEDTKKVKGN